MLKRLEVHAVDKVFLYDTFLQANGIAISGQERELIASRILNSQLNPDSVTNAVVGEWANLAFHPDDLMEIAEHWTFEQREDFLRQHEEAIVKVAYEAALALIHALLHAKQQDLDAVADAG